VCAVPPALLPLVSSSCRTAPPVYLPYQIPGLPNTGKPAWIDQYPVDPAYYIGIGSSKTGNKGEDMELARRKALVALASSISTEIRSELVVAEGESSAGEAYQTVDQVISETVDTNVQEVEVVDSYYAEEAGYWFYLRLSKSAWESIRRDEADRLSRRVAGLVEPALADESASVAVRLGALWKGRMLLLESPYAGLLEGSLDGNNGVLLDIVESRMKAYLESLHLEFRPEIVTAYPGRPAPVAATAKSTLALKPGEITIRLSFGDDVPAIDVTTGADGVYEGVILIPLQETGSAKIDVRMELGSTGIDERMLPAGFSVPHTEALLVLKAVAARLEVAAPREMDATGIRKSLESIFSQGIPVELTASPDAEYEITVEVVAREAPQNAYGIIIAYVKAFVSVSKNGSILESYESPEVKEGGLTASQAYTRTLAKLIELLEGSPDLTQRLKKAFS